jgi:hypothetical protein
MEIQGRPPTILKTSMASPLGGDTRGPGAPTINAKNVDGGPSGIRERPPLTQKNIDDRPAGRRCQRSGSAHHQREKHQWWAPWEVVTEIRERPPSMQKILTAGPLGGAAEDPRAPIINAKNVDGAPPP